MRSVDYRTSSTTFFKHKAPPILTSLQPQQNQQNQHQQLQHQQQSPQLRQQSHCELVAPGPDIVSRPVSCMNSVTGDGALVGQSTGVYRSGAYSNHPASVLWDGNSSYSDNGLSRDSIADIASYRISPSWKIAHDVRPKVTTTLWEEEGTLCFQVEANGICVARREDNNMINGTKLLNVAGMTRGRRDGILKTEKHRHVVKVGAMHLKGVWIPFERAYIFAKKENMVDILYPLFVEDIKSILYDPLKVNSTDPTSQTRDSPNSDRPTTTSASTNDSTSKNSRVNGKFYPGFQPGKPNGHSSTSFQQTVPSQQSHVTEPKHRRLDGSRHSIDVPGNGSTPGFISQYPGLQYEMSYFTQGQPTHNYGIGNYEQSTTSSQPYSGFTYAISENQSGYHEQPNYEQRNNYINQYPPTFATPLPTPPPVFNYNPTNMTGQLDVKPEPLSPIQESSACKKDQASVNEPFQRHYDTNTQVSTTTTTSSEAYGNSQQSDSYSSRVKSESLDTTALKPDVPVEVPFSVIDGRRYFPDNQTANFYMPYEKRFKTDR